MLIKFPSFSLNVATIFPDLLIPPPNSKIPVVFQGFSSAWKNPTHCCILTSSTEDSRATQHKAHPLTVVSQLCDSTASDAN